MKHIITILTVAAFSAVLLNSCQKAPVEKKGVPLTIQASVVAPAGTKTIYDYTDDKMLEGFWDSEEHITVVSFGQSGITAVNTFTSTGERGRKKAEFSGTWTGNAGDKVICLYPAVDLYTGSNSIFDAVRVGSPTIYMRNLSTASGALQHDDPSSISDVDLMLGEVQISGDVAHVYLEHQFAVFRIEVTLRNFPYEAPPGSPFDQARINSIRIKCVDPDSDEEEEWGVNGDPVFVRFSGLDVTTGNYTGTPFTIERGPLDYYLLDSGNNSELCLIDEDVVEKTFFVPVRFDKDLEAGYELCLQFGGNYYDKEEERRYSVTVFPGCDMRKTITSKLPLENGKIYGFRVTI